jgi:hypothetical protein
MFKLKNGWTIKKMLAVIAKRNKFIRCRSHRGKCLYKRDDDGLTCIVGAFIPEKKYTPTMEGQVAVGLFSKFPDLLKHMPLSKDGMARLQSIHDEGFKYSKQTVVNWLQNNVKK